MSRGSAAAVPQHRHEKGSNVVWCVSCVSSCFCFVLLRKQFGHVVLLRGLLVGGLDPRANSVVSCRFLPAYSASCSPCKVWCCCWFSHNIVLSFFMCTCLLFDALLCCCPCRHCLSIIAAAADVDDLLLLLSPSSLSSSSWSWLVVGAFVRVFDTFEHFWGLLLNC